MTSRAGIEHYFRLAKKMFIFPLSTNVPLAGPW